MNAYNKEDNTSRRWGGAALLLYLMGVVCAMLFVRFDSSQMEREADEGILINFGVSDLGSGVEDLPSTEQPTPPPAKSVEREVVEPQLTDERSEVETPPTQEEVVEEIVERPREVNRKALFPGRTESSEAKSQGESPQEEVGNAGDVSGTPEGVEYTLSGRSIVGELPKPDYRENATGKVIIDVVVNERGRVTNATYRAQGSTTNNSTLIDAARSAALKARFSESESFVQGGSITYIFRMD